MSQSHETLGDSSALKPTRAAYSFRSFILWVLAVGLLLVVCLIVFASVPMPVPPTVFTLSAARDKPLACLGSHQSQLVFLDLEQKKSWLVQCPGAGILNESALSPAGDFVAVSHVRTFVMEIEGGKLGAVQVDRPRQYHYGPRPPDTIRFGGDDGWAFVVSRGDDWDVVRLKERDANSDPVFVGWDIGWSDRRERRAVPRDIATQMLGSSGMDYDDMTKLGIVGCFDGKLLEFNSQTDEWREIHQFQYNITTAKWLDPQHAVVGVSGTELIVCNRDGKEICRVETPATLLAVSRSKPWILSGQKFGSRVNVWRFENDQLILDWECDVEAAGIKPWSTWSQLLGR